MQTVPLGEEGVNLPAAQRLGVVIVVVEHHSHRIDIVNVVKSQLLALHLLVDGIGALYACLNLILEAGGVELLPHGSHKLVNDALTRLAALLYEAHYLRILGRMLVAERQVLKLLLYLEQTQTVS